MANETSGEGRKGGRTKIANVTDLKRAVARAVVTSQRAIDRITELTNHSTAVMSPAVGAWVSAQITPSIDRMTAGLNDPPQSREESASSGSNAADSLFKSLEGVE